MIGFYAISKAGRDKDHLYIVVSNDDKYIYVTDGKYKTVGNPKKKNLKHIKVLNSHLNQAETDMIKNCSPGSDEMVKHSLREFRKENKA